MSSIGRYQLVEKLGQGGMGVVYRAFDTLLQRVVAVKVISGSLEIDAEQRERFFREARAAGLLSHRNIITIHDLGEHEGRPYLAMEYLEGEDLQRRRLGPDRMSLARKVEISIEICEGLEYAHARGVVHRDIKPANIFITDDGTTKILDFGLARLLSSELTNSNMMMGTINYMAPEQVRGERADQRSDIFSVGVVLYELLSGRKAFDGASVAATMYKILQEEPEPLLGIEPDLPRDLVAIVERALAKPRDERYQHMAEMLRDLVLCRQQMVGFDSPRTGRPAFGAPRPSDPPQPVPSLPGSDRPTAAQGATPYPPAPGIPPGGTPPPWTPGPLTPQAGAGGSGIRRALPRWSIWIVAALVIAVAALAIWMARPPAPAAPQASGEPAPGPAADEAAVATALRQAAQALEAGDFPAARRHADAALALAPDRTEAREIRDRANATLERETRGLREAREHYDAGRFEEASRAAGDVLSLSPGQPEARRLMQDAAARSRGRGADVARTRMSQAKSAARGAAAERLAAAPYAAAAGAERTAQRLYDAGQLADATAKFYEASGLFRSAELAAQSEAAARTERAAAAAREKEKERAAPVKPEPQPALPVARGADPALLEAPRVPPPAPPPVTAPAAPASAPPAAPAEPPAERLIGELLSSYEAALESRNIGALKRLWPGLSGAQEAAIRNEFEHARLIDVQIAAPRIDVAGGTATAAFVRRYELLTTDGQRPVSRTLTTMTLRRTDAGWVIDQVRFDPVR